jgi:aspartate-semialdehyde dehydrogenase
MAMKKLEVGVLGATGMVGQRLASLLENHPWFELRWLGASDRSAGRKYAEACSWRLRDPMPAGVRDLVVDDCVPDGKAPQLLFASLDSKVAGEVEGAFARGGHAVVSNSSYYRMEPDVPLVIPEVNPGHLALVRAQRRERGWSGMIVTNPNCTTVGLVMSLAPLARAFGLAQVMMTSMQAVSGAGYPGLPALDILGNVIPYIGSEEEKVEAEARKLLGSLDADPAHDGHVEPGEFAVSAHCNRVMVEDGHTETVSVALRSKATAGQVLTAWKGFEAPSQVRGLPSAPGRPIVVRDEVDRPQPRFDVNTERGMAAVIGRLRRCSVLDYKYVVLSHNTIRGAAGAALLNAELLKAEGFLD